MKIALDLEDVIVRTNEVFVEELNNFIRENYSNVGEFHRPEVTTWRYPEAKETLAELQGWNGEFDRKFFQGDSDGWKGYFPITEEIWEKSPERFAEVECDVKSMVSRLREIANESNGELSLVTARENVTDSIMERMEQLSILELFDNIIVEKDKHELDFDIYVDDYPYLYCKLDGARQIMIDRPWNRSEKVDEPHKRVENLEQAVRVIENLG